MTSLFQFSIRGLLVGVTITGVGIAALLRAGPWPEALSFGAALCLLGSALLLVVYRRDERRAFWLGFSVFGWLYLAVLIYSWTPSANSQAARTDPLVESSLLTTRLSHMAYNSLLPESKKQPHVPMMNGDGSAPMTVYYTTGDGQGLTATGTMPAPSDGSSSTTMISLAFTPSGALMATNPDYVPIESFTRIGHTLWLLLIAAVGGKTCQIIYRTRPRMEE
jgi:hypothetical protein